MGDEILSINNYPVKNNLSEWAKYFGMNEVKLIVSNSGKTRTIIFTPSAEEYYKVYYVQKVSNATEAQAKNFTAWSKRKW